MPLMQPKSNHDHRRHHLHRHRTEDVRRRGRRHAVLRRVLDALKRQQPQVRQVRAR